MFLIFNQNKHGEVTSITRHGEETNNILGGVVVTRGMHGRTSVSVAELLSDEAVNRAYSYLVNKLALNKAVDVQMAISKGETTKREYVQSQDFNKTRSTHALEYLEKRAFGSTQYLA